MSSWNVLWKWGGILLLAYVIVAGFSTPLQPGLVEASPGPLTPGPHTLELSMRSDSPSRRRHLPDGHRLILRSGDALIRTELTGPGAAHGVEARK